ncbi:MAG: 7-cyano-7-deazaguanine synthase QueC [Rhodospirillales bacterium]|jgi:7-cyano-7-deazaguanine synthase|nr:7-cyano-7-deazaguanine synthase QueC [Rhodospirillales bacterium]MBT4040385.1 7-cyano-7-deazaguanine synthase QueC [Rhodospirillales bacterium]MBT4627298.1 7-cyano-7-deazaguanine synthase QueC [Rhodospirillales bacterium]MBT5351261.1 7-cyano-7-deazaguanine synthase QueC [Rhodospirillales bacterium]MBT5520098.1 7-cyano-7-deazaguanine synthase QueC [Rhodospirillales bacterium]
MITDDKKALVLFSGGQDSATCVAWALENFSHVETIGFDYGQRHLIEMDMRPTILDAVRNISPLWDDRLGEDHVLDLNVLGDISDTALTSKTEIVLAENGLPNTFVPGRNLVFLNFAGIVAYRRGLGHIVGGMCETDFSGYPDCRNETMKAMAKALGLGMDEPFVIDTPLMWMDKSETWALAESLGGEALVNIIRSDTHTCYLGERGDLHDWGHGCGTCPACELRIKGWISYAAA